MITAIIIAKNEESMIVDAIDSVSFCKQIILIDNNSSDNTAAIAKRFGAEVYEQKTNNFSKLRNFGLTKAKEEWVLYIDADERVSKELAEEIQLAACRNNTTVYKLRRKNFYLGNHPWPKIEEIARFFKKDALYGWKGELHESPQYRENFETLRNFLYHFTHRDLSTMLQKTIEWSDKEAEHRYHSHHPKMTWWRFPRVMITAFYSSYILEKGYKAGTVGIVESIYQAFSMFITYARLWEMQQELSGEKIPKPQ